jgi:rieske iron-sulfur protein
MDPKFNKERRDVLKGTCGLVGAAAVMSVGVSTPAFADPQKDCPQVGDVFVFTDGPKKGSVVMVDDVVLNALPLTVMPKDPNGAVRDGENFTTLLYRIAKDQVPADMAPDTIDGLAAWSAVCTHQGCLMTDIHQKSIAVNAFGFICPCHDAIFDPTQEGKNTGGATSATLAYFPIKSDGGKIVVKDLPSAHVGIKKGR